MKYNVASRFRLALPLAVALSLFTSMLTSAPSASADGGLGPTPSSGAGPLSTYTVIYVGNGNTSGTIPIDSTAYASGAIVNVASQGTLAKSGSIFGGWANGGLGSYQPGQSFTILANTTLTAIWTANTYSVTYVGNGNTSGTVPIDSTAYTAGSTVNVAGQNTLTRSGYTFLGWADGGLGSYQSGQTFSILSNTTLTAIWTESTTFTITYDGNGNTSGTVPNPTVGSGMVTLPGNTGGLVKNSDSFGGWVTHSTGFVHVAGSSYNLTADVTLRAKWLQTTNTYTITYDGNGNTGGSAPSSTVGSGSVTLANHGNLVKSGSTFVNWASQANGSGTSYLEGLFPYNLTADITLYADWSKRGIGIKPYTITYLGNANSGGAAPSSTIGVGHVTLANRGSLVKSGSTFVDWAINANGSGTSYTESSSYNLNADITLYAHWIRAIGVKLYTITYLGNTNTGGSAPSPTIGSGSVTLRNNTGLLVKNGLTFVGWAIQSNGSGPSYPAGFYPWHLNADITLYAKWIRRNGNTYTITYLGNGATAGHVPGPTIGAGPVHLRVNTGALARSLFSFGGWNTQANGLGLPYAIASPYTLNANRTLYAKWNVIKTQSVFSITYLGNNNTSGNVPSSYVGSGSVTLANRGNLVRVDSVPYTLLIIFHFNGWNTQADGLGINFAAGSTYNLNADVTLYAAWNLDYTITYDGNGNTGGAVPASTTFDTFNLSATLATNSGVLTKSGFTFDRWNTQADGLGINFAAGSGYGYFNHADYTLYAMWIANPCALDGPCVIGDTGPGGGKVFYSSPAAFTSVGSACNTACHYLEAAPNTWSGGSADPTRTWAITAYWGTSVAGTSTAIATGLANSNLILAQGNATTAAGAARAYAGGNKQDWYLPSKDELNAMYLQKATIGGFFAGNYWSSSEFDASSPWFQGFDYGNAFNFSKTSAYYVRPVRAF